MVNSYQQINLFESIIRYMVVDVVENFMIQVFVLPKLKRKKHLSVEMGVDGIV